jgi:hypothetical protein
MAALNPNRPPANTAAAASATTNTAASAAAAPQSNAAAPPAAGYVVVYSIEACCIKYLYLHSRGLTIDDLRRAMGMTNRPAAASSNITNAGVTPKLQDVLNADEVLRTGVLDDPQGTNPTTLRACFVKHP